MSPEAIPALLLRAEWVVGDGRDGGGVDFGFVAGGCLALVRIRAAVIGGGIGCFVAGFAGESAEGAGGVAGEQAFFFEGDADAPAELADGGVLLGRQGLEDHRVDDFRAFDGIDAEDLRIGEEEGCEFGVFADFRGDGPEQGNDFVG